MKNSVTVMLKKSQIHFCCAPTNQDCRITKKVRKQSAKSGSCGGIIDVSRASFILHLPTTHHRTLFVPLHKGGSVMILTRPLALPPKLFTGHLLAFMQFIIYKKKTKQNRLDNSVVVQAHAWRIEENESEVSISGRRRGRDGIRQVIGK